jgi:hypothetical protein
VQHALDDTALTNPVTVQIFSNTANGDSYFSQTLHRRNDMSDYVWFWRKRFPERKGQPCRVLVRGKMNSCLV